MRSLILYGATHLLFAAALAIDPNVNLLHVHEHIQYNRHIMDTLPEQQLPKHLYPASDCETLTTPYTSLCLIPTQSAQITASPVVMAPIEVNTAAYEEDIEDDDDNNTDGENWLVDGAMDQNHDGAIPCGPTITTPDTDCLPCTITTTTTPSPPSPTVCVVTVTAEPDGCYSPTPEVLPPTPACMAEEEENPDTCEDITDQVDCCHSNLETSANIQQYPKKRDPYTSPHLTRNNHVPAPSNYHRNGKTLVHDSFEYPTCDVSHKHLVHENCDSPNDHNAWGPCPVDECTEKPVDDSCTPPVNDPSCPPVDDPTVDDPCETTAPCDPPAPSPVKDTCDLSAVAVRGNSGYRRSPCREKTVVVRDDCGCNPPPVPADNCGCVPAPPVHENCPAPVPGGCGQYEHQYGDDAVNWLIDTKDHTRNRLERAKGCAGRHVSHFAPSHVHDRISQVVHDTRPTNSLSHVKLHSNNGHLTAQQKRAMSRRARQQHNMAYNMNKNGYRHSYHKSGFTPVRRLTRVSRSDLDRYPSRGNKPITRLNTGSRPYDHGQTNRDEGSLCQCAPPLLVSHDSDSPCGCGAPVETQTPCVPDCNPPPPPPPVRQNACGCAGSFVRQRPQHSISRDGCPEVKDRGSGCCSNIEHQYGDDTMNFLLDTKDHTRNFLGRVKERTKHAISHFAPCHVHDRVDQFIHDERPERSEDHLELHENRGYLS